MNNKKFRHQLHKRSPALRQIAEAVDKYGHYYFDKSQKRKPTSWRQVGDYVVIEGLVIN